MKVVANVGSHVRITLTPEPVGPREDILVNYLYGSCVCVCVSMCLIHAWFVLCTVAPAEPG